MLRPGAYGSSFLPLSSPLPADPGPGWDPARYRLPTMDEQPLGRRRGTGSNQRAWPAVREGYYGRAAIHPSRCRGGGPRPTCPYRVCHAGSDIAMYCTSTVCVVQEPPAMPRGSAPPPASPPVPATLAAQLAGAAGPSRRQRRPKGVYLLPLEVSLPPAVLCDCGRGVPSSCIHAAGARETRTASPACQHAPSEGNESDTPAACLRGRSWAARARRPRKCCWPAGRGSPPCWRCSASWTTARRRCRPAPRSRC